ncbi:protein kinase [Thermopolyspora sp. NPDC052614]|uniref:protein kinase domain-containing protein n=1 Tax=Thermopolyspora sp. NPDC052614 TaxID=3155682 RepID=UPI0034471358
MPNPEPLRPGDPDRVGRYRLSARLGEGGQGVVYLGTSPTGTRVAVKVLRADLATDEDALERFVREVSVAQRVATFCTAQVIETAVDDGRPYIVSEYIDGPTLDAVVTEDGPRSGNSLHRLAIGTVTALVAIHQAGIVHRDFKPSNVLLGDDGPRVIDFGIARALDRTSTLTSMVIGTPAYMTPEQLAGDPPGPATDMFAWGCTMVFAATGEPPFGTDSLPAVFNRIMHKEPDVSALQEPLRGLVAQCLDKDPERRPAAGEVLMRLLGHAPAPTPPEAILAEGSAAATQISIPGNKPLPPQWASPAGDSRPGEPQPGAPQSGASQPGAPRSGASQPVRHEPVRARQGDQGRGAEGGAADGPAYVEGVTFARPPAPAAGPYRPPQPSQPYPYPGGQPQGGHHQGFYQGAPYQGHPQGGYQGGPYPGSGGHPGGPAGPWQGPGGPQGPGPAEQTGPSGGGNRGLMVVLGAIGGVVLLVGGIFLTIQLTGGSGGSQSPSPEVVAQSDPARTSAPPSNPPSSPAQTSTPLPTPTGKVDLPGLDMSVYENADDPIKLSSYRYDEGRNVYLRDGERFSKTSKYFEIAYDTGMTRLVAPDVQLNADGYATVSIVDRATGKSRKVVTVKSPQYVWSPVWSPDGTKVLLTVHSRVGEKSTPRGFGIIDAATGKWTFSRVKDTQVGEWSYFWPGDGQTVGTWATGGGTDAIRLFNLDGTVLRTLDDVGAPLAVTSYDVAPRGDRFLSLCRKNGSEVCVWTLADGREVARIPFPTQQLIGWYDDEHLAGWRKRESGQPGYEAVVFDLKGNVVRLLATATDDAYQTAFLLYARQR